MAQNKQPETTQKRVSSETITAVSYSAGPLPDPATLDRYNKIDPTFAERIMIMAEKEQAKRHINDNLLIINQHHQHNRDTVTFRIGQFLAIIAVFSSLHYAPIFSSWAPLRRLQQWPLALLLL